MILFMVLQEQSMIGLFFIGITLVVAMLYAIKAYREASLFLFILIQEIICLLIKLPAVEFAHYYMLFTELYVIGGMVYTLVKIYLWGNLNNRYLNIQIWLLLLVFIFFWIEYLLVFSGMKGVLMSQILIQKSTLDNLFKMIVFGLLGRFLWGLNLPQQTKEYYFIWFYFISLCLLIDIHLIFSLLPFLYGT